MDPTIHSTANTDHLAQRAAGGRTLALLEGDHSGLVTLSALRERGVRAPAQAIYDLQLAGHLIDRVTGTDSGGHASFGYRLRRPGAARETNASEAEGAITAST
jgi:hypothetical protein